MDKEENGKPKILSEEPQEDSQEPEHYEDPTEEETHDQSSIQAEVEKYMEKKKNLQIEVIDHPEADSKAEHVAKGDGSVLESDPNQFSQQEPDYRKGTENEEFEEEEYEEEYEEEEEEPHGQSYKSFGEPQAHEEDPEMQKDPGMIKENAPNSKISDGLMQEFMQKKDDFNKTTMLAKQDQQPSFENQENYTEEVGQTEESKIDDNLVERQAREAEELLEEAQKIIHDDEQEPSDEEEGEEDEIEDIAKMAKENRIYELNPEEEEEEDEDNNGPKDESNKFELNYTIGRIEDGAAVLISKDHNLIEIPLWLLPTDIGPGNILKFSVDRNVKAEQKRVDEILSIQKQILEIPDF